MSAFHNWLLEIAGGNYFVYIKRLSANDTGATGGIRSAFIFLPVSLKSCFRLSTTPVTSTLRSFSPLMCHLMTAQRVRPVLFTTMAGILVKPEMKKDHTLGKRQPASGS